MTSREEWRAWLQLNHTGKKEIWLVHYKKHTDKTTISYDDAVEEALCFGWIDGIMKKLDNEKYVLRYTPRRKKSIWSDLNKQRVAKMVEQGLMTEAGMTKIEEAKRNGEWEKAIKRESAPAIPPDLQKALQANKTAAKNFKAFAPSYQKQYIWWINSAKRDETRSRRVSETVRRSEHNTKPGI